MKSFSYPYICEQVGGVWVMRDGIGEKPRRIPRKSEVVTFGKPAIEVVSAIRGMRLGRHFVSHLHGNETTPKDIRDQYKALAYRTLLSEEFFVHRAVEVPAFDCSPRVRRVTTIEESEVISGVRRNRKAIRDCDLSEGHAEHYLYAVIDGARPCGWVGSVPFGDTSWIADLYVLPEHRGKGYGRSLMSRVTQEDKKRSVGRSVLLASSAGARLYPHLGYEPLGTLQLFCPAKYKTNPALG